MKKSKTLGRVAAVILCLLLTMMMVPSSLIVNAKEKEEENVVRVGWYESPFNLFDQYGRRSGYAYDYQMKISAYTGWEYEYVTGSWPELYQMLLDGKIDMLSDVSYTPERAESMLFSAMPMGSEVYYACVSAKRDVEKSADDISSFSGKRIAVNKGSLQESLLRDCLESNNIEAEIVEMTVTEPEIVEMLHKGDIDMFVDIDVFGVTQDLIPVYMIGSSDIFFAVNADRQDLMNELNNAMVRIHEEDRNYNQHLQEKYFNSNIVNMYFSQNEVKWLAAHGSIRVGYQDNFLAFCAQDPETGKLDGALKDYLNIASKCMQNAIVDFTPVPFDNLEDAITALNNGEVDCVFPVDLSAYEGEERGLLTTEPVIQTEVYAAVRSDNLQYFSLSGDVSVALFQKDPNVQSFVRDYFPRWKTVFFESREECFKAVAEGKADCALISNYRLGKIASLLEKNELTVITTGRSMKLSFAVDEHNDVLYAVLNRISHYVPESAVTSALVSYSYDEKVITLEEILQEHLPLLFTVFGFVLLIILAFFARSVFAEKHAKASLKALQESLDREEKQQKELDATKNIAYTDPLTGVKSKNAYARDIGEWQHLIAKGEKPEFAVVVFDVNDLKHVNDNYGHEAGDGHIISAKKLICNFFKRSPVYRIGGDEFVVILTDAEYDNGIMTLSAFNQQIEYNLKTGLTVVSAGYAQFQPEIDSSFSDVFRRADEQMYHRKRYLKGECMRTDIPQPIVAVQSAAPAAAAAPASVSRTVSVPPAASSAASSGNEDITIAYDGIEIRAGGNVTAEKLGALMGSLSLGRERRMEHDTGRIQEETRRG